MNESVSSDTPLNAVELAIATARQAATTGTPSSIDEEMVAQTIWANDLIVPSRTPANRMEELQPLTFSRPGVTVIAAFSDPRRVGDLAQEAPHLLVLSGRELFTRIADGLGVVINPRTPALGMEISASGIRQAVNSFA